MRFIWVALIGAGCPSGGSMCPTWFPDRDQDGFGTGPGVVSCPPMHFHVHNDQDCDDTDPMVHPEAIEICDPEQRDEDCDGVADDADADAQGQTPRWIDADGDGFASSEAVWSCVAASGVATPGTDCDDGDADTFPGAASADGDGCHRDADGDGYGDATPAAPVAPGSDCDDGDADTFPSAPEAFADGIDQDCDGVDWVDLVDDFELGFLDPEVWGNSQQATAVEGVSHSGAFAMVLRPDATATTVPLDTQGCTEISWQLRLLRTDTRDSTALRLQHDGAGWLDLESYPGDRVDPWFNLYEGRSQDPALLRPDLRLRLLLDPFAPAEDGTVSVDDFSVACHGPDLDGDGEGAGVDCDDTDPLHSRDCGICVDGDGDGHGLGCDLGEDCDDTDPAVHPGAPDAPGDAVDADCDGVDGILIYDDFEAGGPDPLTFVASEGSVRGDWFGNAVWDIPMQGDYDLELFNGGALITRTVDTTGCDQVSFEYLVRYQATTGTPQLVLEYDLGAGWVTFEDWSGDGPWWLPEARSGVFDASGTAVRFRIRNPNHASINIDQLALGCTADADGDGVLADCDDGDPLHALDCETCIDGDGDGHGPGCDLALDCDDGDPNVHPGQPDPIGDGLDADCSGTDGPSLYEDFEGTLGVIVGGWGEVSEQHAASGQRALALEVPNAWVQTPWMDTAGCGALQWRYDVQRGPWAPGRDQILTLESFDGTAWQILDQIAGIDSEDVGFVTRSGPFVVVPAGVELRLSVEGDTLIGSTFYVDDLRLLCGDDLDGDSAFDPDDCDPADPAHWSDCGTCVDLDRDGFGVDCDLGVDCEDSDPTIHVGGVEIAGDGIDRSCDGLDDPWLFDDFEAAGQPNPVVWDGAWGLVTDAAVPPASGSYAVALLGDELPSGNGGLQSRTLDTTACTAVDWSLQLWRGPLCSDDHEVRIEYLDRHGSWVTDDLSEAGCDPQYRALAGTLPTDALHASLQFRIRVVSIDVFGALGSFSLDDVLVECRP